MQSDSLFAKVQDSVVAQHPATLDKLREERFDRLTRLAQHLFAVPLIVLVLQDVNQQSYIVSAQGEGASELDYNNTFIHATWENSDQSFLVIPDTRLDNRFAFDPLVNSAPYIRFYAGQVLYGLDGQKAGALCLWDTQPHPPLNEQEKISLRDLSALLEQELARLQEKPVPSPEAQLAESEAKFRKLAETVPMAISIYRDNGYFYVNPAFVEITGYSAEECKTLSFQSLTHPEDAKFTRELALAHLHGEKASPRYQLRIITKSGEVRWIETSVDSVKFEGKLGILGTALDITERKQAEQAQREQNQYLATLHETALALMNRLDLTELLQVIITKAADLVRTSHGFIYLLEPGATEMTMRVGLGAALARKHQRLKPGEGVVGKVWQSGRPLIIEDYGLWDERIPNSSSAEKEQSHSVLGLPLKSGDQVIGVLGLIYPEPERIFGAKEINWLSRFAELAALALDNARLYSAAQRRLSEIALVQQVAQASNSSLQTQEVFRTTVNRIHEAFGYERVGFYLHLEDSLIPLAQIGLEPSVIKRMPINTGITGRVVQTGRAEFVQDVTRDPDFVALSPDIRQFIVVPLKTRDGEVLGALSVGSKGDPPLTEEDFTLLKLVADQVSVAAENARLFTELRQSEEKYREVVTHLKEVIFSMDQQGRFTFLNPAWEELTGYTIEETLGLFPLDYVHPDDKEYTAKLFSELIRGQRTDYRIEIRAVARDKTTKWLEITGRVIPASNSSFPNQITGITGTILDITDRKQAEEERQNLERKLLEAQRLESLGVLAGGIAHDFNNLLAGILGNTQMARAELAPGSEVLEILAQVETAAQQAAQLTQQMLAYSGKGRLVVQPLKINRIVSETASLLNASIAKNVRLLYDLGEQLPLLEGDIAQLRQVVLSLVSNASEALSGKPEGTIRLTTGRMQLGQADLTDPSFISAEITEGSYIYLEVADNGAGMDKATLARIFDPFFTTKFTGRGLGLAAVLGVVRGHKGALKVISQPGVGTTVRILLPAVSVSDQEIIPALPAPPAPEHHLAEASLENRPTILVVDDEPLVRKLMARLLEQAGYQVIIAVDGESGVAAFREHAEEIDCVLLDMTMPGLNGDEAFRQISQIRPDTPVILVSGYSEQEVSERFAGKGLRGFIQKPFTLKEILNAVQGVLASSSADNDSERPQATA